MCVYIKLCFSSCLSPWFSFTVKIPDRKVHLHACSSPSPGFYSCMPSLESFLLRFACSAPSKPTGLFPDSVSFHLSVGSFKQMTLIPEILCPWNMCPPVSPAAPSLCLSPLPPDSYMSYTQHSLNFYLLVSLLFANPLLPVNDFNYSVYTAPIPRPPWMWSG